MLPALICANIASGNDISVWKIIVHKICSVKLPWIKWWFHRYYVYCRSQMLQQLWKHWTHRFLEIVIKGMLLTAMMEYSLQNATDLHLIKCHAYLKHFPIVQSNRIPRILIPKTQTAFQTHSLCSLRVICPVSLRLHLPRKWFQILQTVRQVPEFGEPSSGAIWCPCRILLQRVMAVC